MHTLLCGRCVRNRQYARRRIEDHIIESIENLLDPLQEAWSQLCASKGIERDNLMITSGYRCRELNNRMKESSTSAHTIGYAFDLLPANRLIMDFRKFCKDYLSDKPFDQLISEQEDNSGIPSWIHIGYKDHQGRQHRRMLSMREERSLGRMTGSFVASYCLASRHV